MRSWGKKKLRFVMWTVECLFANTQQQRCNLIIETIYYLGDYKLLKKETSLDLAPLQFLDPYSGRAMG